MSIIQIILFEVEINQSKMAGFLKHIFLTILNYPNELLAPCSIRIFSHCFSTYHILWATIEVNSFFQNIKSTVCNKLTEKTENLGYMSTPMQTVQHARTNPCFAKCFIYDCYSVCIH